MKMQMSLKVLNVSSGTIDGTTAYASLQAIDETQKLSTEGKVGFSNTKMNIRNPDNLDTVDLVLAKELMAIRQASNDLLCTIECDVQMKMTGKEPQMVVTGITKKAAK